MLGTAFVIAGFVGGVDVAGPAPLELPAAVTSAPWVWKTAAPPSTIKVLLAISAAHNRNC
ncbi:hypothetical protein ACGFK1_04340 [Mycobacterium sp. NPDC048908]|uniref:hypothetical protein n=1 Tax=Mycobacterium sp. NPDC048908 TaxID=3364292 RepID=UPI003711BB9A